MDIISAEEWEVLGFFGVDPETNDDTPWPYNDFLFEISRDNQSLSCSIAPADKDVRIIIKQNYNKIYELNAVGINDVEYLEETDGKEVLIIALNEKEFLMLTVNPNIEINHYYENAP